MKLIFGLGNPGINYTNTRHNAGFIVLDYLKDYYSFGDYKRNSRFIAEISEGFIENVKVLLVKPLTYMNLSGDSVTKIINYYKVKTEDICVIHDDIDLPLGKIRFKDDSSSGGHNGIKSIINKLGTKKFKRIKIGVDNRSNTKIGTKDYVLSNFSEDELDILKDILETERLKIISKSLDKL